MRKARTIALSAALTLSALAAMPAVANAAFGDLFGIAPVNMPGAPSSLAFPGTSAFWAGTCDLGSAPVGPVPGGVGSRPDHVWAPRPGSDALDNVAVPAPASPDQCIDWGRLAVHGEASKTNLWKQAPAWRLAPAAQAGAHPDGTATMWYRRAANGTVDGSVDNIVGDLPVGFVGNPTAVPKCTAEQFAVKPIECPPQTQVGVIRLYLVGAPLGGSNYALSNEEILPLYNLEPRHGHVAEVGFPNASGEDATTVRIFAKARTNADFGVTALTVQVPAALPLIASGITLWGVPWSSAHDEWRPPQGWRPLEDSTGEIPPSGLLPADRVGYDPSWGELKPFLSNPTECSGEELSTRLSTDSYEHPGAFTSEGDVDLTAPTNWMSYTSLAPPLTGCEKVPFAAGIHLQPSSTVADSPSGLAVDLSVPQNNDLPFPTPGPSATQPEVDAYLAAADAHWRSDAGLATSHLEDTVVTLPEGMTLTPAAADGLAACSTAQIGLKGTGFPAPTPIRFDNDDPSDGKGHECPEASKLATVTLKTPLLEPADYPTGEVYLATQRDNPFGSNFAIYIALRWPDRGVVAKLAGKVEPDPLTGRLKTTFADNPQLPFERFELRFKGGPRSPVATPTTCGTFVSENDFTPWSAPADPVHVSDPFNIASAPAGGCPATKAARPLDLGFDAGSTNPQAGRHSPFTARLTRPDGNQEFDTIDLSTPPGFAANLRGVPFCPEAAIAAARSRTATGDGALERANPSCPAASQVGTTTIGAGAGPAPFYASGKIYFAGPYKGAPLSLAFVVPAIAGPFDLGVQVVRTALQVNPRNLQITAQSDPIPQILAGVPLRIRDIRVSIDRDRFTLNPTNCEPMSVDTTVHGASGAVANLSERFQVDGCEELGFKPRIGIRLFGGTRRGAYQGLRATLTARPGDANIARASVTLPHSAFLAQEHIRTVCTRVQFAAHACPRASIYGYAEATTPLLEEPVKGPVYLRSSDNTLPDLVAALRGPDRLPVEVELSGRTDSINGGIRNTFDVIPDAQVSKFTLRLQGGKKGLIVNSQNLCASAHRADVRLTAQNGRRHSFRPTVTNPACAKQSSGAKRKRNRDAGRR